MIKYDLSDSKFTYMFGRFCNHPRPSSWQSTLMMVEGDCKSDRTCRSIRVYDEAYFIIVHLFVSHMRERKAFRQTTFRPWWTRHTLGLG